MIKIHIKKPDLNKLSFKYKLPFKKPILKNYQWLIILLSATFIALFLSVRGFPGNPTINELNTQKWKNNGPLELSPERGRFALLYSIVENNSVFFSNDVARFAIPDLGYFNGKFVSLFAPGISYIIIPGYVLGRHFGFSQIGVFLEIVIFALLNCYLIYKISRLLDSKFWPSIIAFIIFMFGTPAYAYSVTLYQHHISTFLMLMGIYLYLKYNNLLSLGLIWFLCAISISVDYPNLFIMAPIGILSLGKIIHFEQEKHNLKLDFKPFYLLSFSFIILPLLFFFWFNKISYGSPFQLAGTVSQVREIDANGKPTDAIAGNAHGEIKDLTSASNIASISDLTTRSAINYFGTRTMLTSLYILFLSPDRGVINYAPIILLGIFGIYTLYQRQTKHTLLLFSILLVNILVYAMWNDPWGGWAFGARYLIPAYAVLAIFSSVTLTKLKSKFLLVPIFIIYLYCLYINTAGAITSNANPPQVEVLALEKLSGTVQKYTPARNLDQIKNNNSKSFVFNLIKSKDMTAQKYFYYLYGYIAVITGSAFIIYFVRFKDE